MLLPELKDWVRRHLKDQVRKQILQHGYWFSWFRWCRMGDVQVRQGVMRSARYVHTLWETPHFAHSHSKLLLAVWFRTLNSWWLIDDCTTASEENSYPHLHPYESQDVSYFCISCYKKEFYISLAQYTQSWQLEHMARAIPQHDCVPLEHSQYCSSLAKEAVRLCRTQVLWFGRTQTGTAFNWRTRRLSGALKSRRIGALSYEKC